MFSLSFSFKKQHGEGDAHHVFSLAKWGNVTHVAALLQERKNEGCPTKGKPVGMLLIAALPRMSQRWSYVAEQMAGTNRARCL
jgi:hypothetical protein